MSSAQLIVKHGSGSKMVDLDDQPLTIGRHPDSRLCLEDDRVSRHHCVIRPKDGGYELIDLGARNGTLLNGERCTSVMLSSGDKIIVGGALIRYEVLEPTVEGEPVQAGQPARKQSAIAQRERPDSPPVVPPPPPPAPTGALEMDEPEEDVPDLSNPDLSFQMPTPDEPSAAPPAEGRRGRASAGDALVSFDADSGDVQRMMREASDRLTAFIAKLGGMEFDADAMQLMSASGQMVRMPSGGRIDGSVLLRQILMLCMKTRATDVHIEPHPDVWVFRVRIDGMMVDAGKFPPPVGMRLINVVKVMANIDIAQKAIIQEGHFTSKPPDRSIDYRVSFTPAMHGQKLVLRVLDLINAPQRIDELQMSGWMVDAVKRTVKRDAGMVMVCGPTGSGKTTTLYSVIRDIDRQRRNVITIEDPIEYNIDGVTQLPINETKGNTFAGLLRSVLRQDPDVILLGEIRDAETARIAMQAAVTGHLVLSTVHARDVIGTVYRLMDLGAEPHLMAAALNIVIAQRLVRMLCPHCKRKTKLRPSDQMRMGRLGQGIGEICEPNGCSQCFGTGYHGRRGLYEMMTTTEEVRNVLLGGMNMQELRKALSQTLFTTLRESGFRLVAEGLTDLAEVERVAGAD